MWPVRVGQGEVGEQGGRVAAAGGQSHMVQGGREEGARPKTLHSSSHDAKSFHCDSHNDSGFISESNLVSSSSLSIDDTLRTTTDAMRCDDDFDVGRGDSKTSLNSSKLDSGIDISEQLSSLHLASASCPSSTTSSGVGVEVESPLVSPARAVSPTPPRRPRLGLSDVHVAMLQEIFQRDEDGDTQLHVAIMRGFVEVVYNITRLLPHQAFLDLPNNSGKTALHLAVAAGESGLARHLIVCGASPVMRDRRGNTPLHVAAAQGNSLIVHNLTRPVTVAEVIAARLSYAPAHTAGLLAADLANYDGQTCIHLAAQGGQAGHREILQHLTWYGADINAREGKSGRTALHYAVEARDPELVHFLAESCRVSLTLETYAGLTPYQLALANGATGLANLLLELGAPGDDLPPCLTAGDDLDYDEDPSSDGGSMATSNGWGVVDDLRIGGVPVPMSVPVPVTSSNPFNADLYF